MTDLAIEADAAAKQQWLAGRVPFSRQSVFKHLVVLEQAGLGSRRKQDREFYQVQAGRSDELPVEP